MIKSEIKAALEALKKIKMQKIKNKDLRNLLIEDHFTLLKVGRRTETKLEDIRKVMMAPYEEDQEKILNLQKEYQGAESDADRRRINREINEFTEYDKASRDYFKKVEEVNKEEIKGLKKIDRQAFMEAIEDQDYTLEWVEALYPLFVLDDSDSEEKPEKPKKSNK